MSQLEHPFSDRLFRSKPEKSNKETHIFVNEEQLAQILRLVQPGTKTIRGKIRKEPDGTIVLTGILPATSSPDENPKKPS